MRMHIYIYAHIYIYIYIYTHLLQCLLYMCVYVYIYTCYVRPPQPRRPHRVEVWRGIRRGLTESSGVRRTSAAGFRSENSQPTIKLEFGLVDLVWFVFIVVLLHFYCGGAKLVWPSHPRYLCFIEVCHPWRFSQIHQIGFACSRRDVCSHGLRQSAQINVCSPDGEGAKC